MKMLEDTNELLFRAVRPSDAFWKDKEAKKLSSAAFKDKNVLSVDRKGDRTTEAAIENAKEKFEGTIISVTVGNCKEKEAIVTICPTDDNEYHCEIINSIEKKLLTKSQAKHLAACAVVY